MRKQIASLLIFLFTVQIVTPSFAQQSSNIDFLKLTQCMNQLSDNGKLFKNDAEKGDNSDRLNMMKGLLAMSISTKLLIEFIPVVTSENASGIPIGGTLGSLAGLIMSISGLQEESNLLKVAIQKLPITASDLDNMGIQNLKKEIIRSKKFIAVTAAAVIIFGALTYWSLKNKTKKQVDQNNQEVSAKTLLMTTSELAFTQQLTSNSKSAKDTLSTVTKGCQKILAEVRSYQQDPELFYQELEAHKM